MTPELTYLTYGTALLLVHILAQATLSDLSKGLGWALGSQDEPRDQNIYAERLQQALRNFLETYPAFVALALALTVAGLGTATSALGAALWFWGRVAYIPCRMSGLPLVRSVAWLTSLVGLVLMVLTLLAGAPAGA